MQLPDHSRLPNDWAAHLGRATLRAEILLDRLHPRGGTSAIYPPRQHVFRAFHETPFDEVRVVILGQDPYYDRPGKADGLAFSISDAAPVDSLQMVFDSLASDVPGFTTPAIGDLSSWASRGVLLANAALTVPAGMPGQHLRAWSGFTRAVLYALDAKVTPVAFMLWGKKAISRGDRLPINRSRHHVIEAAHPRRGAKWQGKSFAEFEVFKGASSWIASQPGGPIRWSLP